MPLGFERLNERTQRPNTHINFIKPLSGADSTISQDFLSRIAAQCYPVMRTNHISVMSLEEHAPNPEFLGRNFNAGEVIQLVLKDKWGRWLSFRFVQMVMMHELAHCKEMNHGRGFWKVRNTYAEEMQGLWKRSYVGEGLWGRGKGLGSGRFEHDRVPEGGDIPEHLCGGTYRRARGRKRKRGDGASEKPKETYAERQQKRIQRKFGKHGDGNALGDDELVRGGLEKKRHVGKPKVANSKRGRDLRAAAALARFSAQNSATPEGTPELDEDDGSETEWYDSDDDPSSARKDKHITDGQGHDMVRVCGDEEENEGAQGEMDELRAISTTANPNKVSGQAGKQSSRGGEGNDRLVTLDDPETESDPDEPTSTRPIDNPPSQPTNSSTAPVLALTNDTQLAQPKESTNGNPNSLAPPVNTATELSPQLPQLTTSSPTACPICSLENEASSTLCLACSHVLKPTLVRGHWRCGSESCRSTGYLNPGDAGRCGICGGAKGEVGLGILSGGRRGGGADTGGGGGGGEAGGMGVGVTGADVLRWD